MTNHDKERDADRLAILRAQFDGASLILRGQLIIIGQYLYGAPHDPAVEHALLGAPDRMNEIRALLTEIEAIAGRAEHPHRYAR